MTTKYGMFNYFYGDSHLRTLNLNSLEIFKPVSIQDLIAIVYAKDLAW